MSNKLNLTEEEQKKINTICDYLFFDQYTEMSTYMRFERCFQPLYSEEKDIDMEDVFKEICGPKKKYLNYKRFVKAYLNYKANKVSKELKDFFDKLFNSILRPEQVGEFEGGKLTFSTRKANKNRECITMIEVLDDNDGVIHGINVTFDEIFTNKLYPTKLEDSLSVGLEVSLKILDEKKLEKRALTRYIKDSYFRDAITHIFGTVDDKTKFITFLGFKCISGKTQFVGSPKGNSFLIGEFGKKMNQLKCQMTKEGISCLLPYLDQNYRPNVYLSKKIGNITLDDINKDEIILDERYLSKLTDKEEIDKYITTALIDDAQFFNADLKDEVYGNSLKEVIRRQPRRWMRERMLRRGIYPMPRRFFTLHDFMRRYDEESRRRRYFMGPGFGLYDRFGLHRRRRLYYGLGGPYGPYPRHFSPFGPRPPFGGFGPRTPFGRFGPETPSMRAFSLPGHGPHGPFGPHHPPFMDPTPIYSVSLPHGPQNAQSKSETPIYSISLPHGPHHPFMMPPHYPMRSHHFFPGSGFPYGPMHHYPRPYFPYPHRHMPYGPDFAYPRRFGYPQMDNGYDDNYQEDWEQEQQQEYENYIKTEGSINRMKEPKIKNTGVKQNLKVKPGQKYVTNIRQINQEYDNIYDQQYSDYYQDGYAQFEDYGDNIMDEQYSQKVNYNYKPKKQNAKVIKTNIPAKYLRKDLLQSSNYITHQTVPCRPKPKKEQVQPQYEEQQEQIEPEQLQYEQQQAELEQAKYAEQINQEQQEQIQPKYEEQIPQEQIQPEPQQEIQKEEVKVEQAQKEGEADVHPEENTSLEELDSQLESLKKLLEDQNLKEEEKKKLLELQKLYTTQKNILLDNEEKKEKEEMMKKSDIKLDDYIKEEQEKREKEEEEIEEKIKKELDKNIDKTEAKIVSVTEINPSKIFRNQEMYKGEQPWKDPLFTPCKDNLCPSNEKGWILPENVLFTDVDGWEKYNWSRVEEILNSKNYQVFEDGISPDDIIQGSIGDCYFLSAIGSLCKFSNYIDRLFLTKERTKEHLYGVFIFLNATWKLVLIDDYLPYTGKKFKKFAFSSSGGKELWVALLEKAWAKINGNYAKIGCGGSPTEVFDVLTEAYTEQVQVHPYYKDYIWETMINAEKKGYIMTAGSSADITNLNLDEVGLCAGHAYTVLGVLEIDTGKGIEKVVHLRNPYGNGEFNGDWSDYSEKWTPELKKKYNLVIKDDGDFYMAFDDFLNYYITLGICKLHPGYKTTTLKIKNPATCQITKVTVDQDEVHSFLQIYQKNPRIPAKDGTKPKLVYNYLMLVDENFNYIYSVSNSGMHNGIEQTLKKGTYYLLSDVNYRYSNPNKKNYSYVITCYSQTELNLENVTANFDITNVLQSAVYSYCRMYVPPTKCSNGVYLYRAATNMDSIPFETAIFENYTDKDYKVKLNIVGKGEKSFCFYEDEIATENDITTIKELPKNSVAIFTALKYSASSIFNFKYFFAPLKAPNPNNPTALRAPKIYDEPPVIQPPQPNTEANANENINTQEVNQENNTEKVETKVTTEVKTITKEPNVEKIETEVKTEKIITQNVIPQQTETKVVKKKGGHPVFKTQGEVLDENGVLIQYYLDNGEEFVIGLENRSNMKVKMQLIIEGAVIVNTGKSLAVFYSNPRERKIFKAKKINNGNVAFQFDYAE